MISVQSKISHPNCFTAVCMENRNQFKRVYVHGLFDALTQNMQSGLVLVWFTVVVCQVEQDTNDGPHTVFHRFAHVVSYILVKQRLIVW